MTMGRSSEKRRPRAEPDLEAVDAVINERRDADVEHQAISNGFDLDVLAIHARGGRLVRCRQRDRHAGIGAQTRHVRRDREPARSR